MSLGISADHAELGASLRSWAASIDPVAAVRAAEGDPLASFSSEWAALTSMSVPTIGLPASAGGGGGSALDVAVALEACAYALVPGHVLSTATAAALVPSIAPELVSGARVAVGLGDVVLDAPGADLFLLSSSSGYVVSSSGSVTPGSPLLDLSRRCGTVSSADGTPVDLAGGLVHRTFVTFAAAEAAGVARWCLDTAVAYAKVREQFGAKIGSFQAIKHLGAEMLETVTAVEAVAWDVASAAFGSDDLQWAYSVDVAATVAFDGAVRVAQDCIQVLGGIGYTFEHDAHLYLRRALALRSLAGTSSAAAASLAGRAVAGSRRTLTVDLGGRDAAVRPHVASLVASLDRGDPRAGLVSTGLLMPHWPSPYGLDADAVTQLVVDEELAAAGISRPDLKIAGWAVPTILSHGTPEQQERFVRPSLLGEITWCQLFSEPGAGSDLASLRMRAVRDGDGWRLTGQKVWTSLAQDAEWAICLARTDPDAPQHKGITYFLVNMSSPGIDVRPLRELTGDALFNEVFLDDVYVPSDCVVGAPGDGWRLARTTLSNERVAMAGHRLGVSIEGCVAAVGPDPVDRARVGHQVALATVCSLLGVRTTLKALAGQGPGAESSVAKLLGVRNRQEASSLLVELLGPSVVLGGAEAEAAVHEMLVTRCLSIAGGTTQILRNVAAERILGLPR
ncbi:MAG: acyl-CoA dehydrogenase family protein [Nocardioides sp.]|uniref:acyl-CoA dehydrogenase family protein n=1 Tax=Nocardioides sp. TaxID=35761 RepID=UPI00326315CF